MAKKNVAPSTEEATEAVAVALSKRLQNAVDAIRQPFLAFAAGFAALSTDRATLAPKFMKAFGAWQAEAGGTFVQFVRLFDITVPEERTGYRAHAVYQAADYLRRLAARSNAQTTEPRDPNAPRPVTPVEAVARLIATMSPFVEDMDLIWKAFVQELHWSERQISRVQKLVGQAGPLLTKKGREHKLRLLPQTHAKAS